MKNSALKISLIFIVIGVAWIIFTDGILTHLIPEGTFLLAQNIKGIFFVVVTSFIIYQLVSKEQQSLLESRAQYKRLFEENPVPMWIYNPSTGNVEEANDAALEGYKYARAAFLRLKIDDLIPEHTIDNGMIDEETLKSFLDKGISTHKKSDGSTFFVQAKTHETVFNNKKLNMVMALDLHHLIIAKNKIHMQNENLRKIAHWQSHSMRRPVANILGLITLYKSDKCDLRDAEIIDLLQKECTELDNMIKSIVQKSEDVWNVDNTLTQDSR